MSVYEYKTKKDGKQYGARFRIIDNGREVHKNLRGFTIKTEAKKAEFEYKSLFEKQQETTNLQPNDDGITFGEVYELYKKWAIDNLAPGSIYSYFNVAKLYILPTFEFMPIKKITRLDLSNWQDTLSSDLSFRYKSQIRNTMSGIFTYAVNKMIVPNNPLQQTEKIRNTTQASPLNYWEKKEFDEFIAKVDNPKYKALFYFLYVSGCRKGESFALQWNDIHFEKQTITINKTHSVKGLSLVKKLGKKVKPRTKNKKFADIYMPKSVLDLINGLPRVTYVFGGEKPLSATQTTRVFDRYIELAGVKRIRLHDLRHSCAALIISTSSKNNELATLYAIAERLRDTPEMILKTYGHLFPSRQAKINETLNLHFNNII